MTNQSSETTAISQLNAAVLRAITKQSGMSFLPTTQRRIDVDAWIDSLTEQQKLELIAVADECHDAKHPCHHTVNDALSLITSQGMTETLFTIIRYRNAFASPWKIEHGTYTPTMRFINGIRSMTDLDIMNCTEEEFARISAVLRYAHDVKCNPDLQDMGTIWTFPDTAAGGVTSIYADMTLYEFVWEHYQHVDEMVQVAITRQTDDMELMLAMINTKGSRALIEGIL
jgi:hypothetical protein